MASRNGVIPILAYNGIMDGANPRGLATTNNNVHYWVYGHSLFTYDAGAAPASQGTRVGEWLGLFAAANGIQFSGGGVFGQISTHNANNPPTAPGYTYATNSYNPWPSGSFGDQNFNACIFMPSNFEQTTETPTAYSTQCLTLIDNTTALEPTIPFWLYHHWDEFLYATPADPESLTSLEFQAYRNSVRGAYLTWFDELQTILKAERPSVQIKLMPIGAVIADVQEMSELSGLTWTDYYGDDAPHGGQNTYFIAALAVFRILHGANLDTGSFSFPVWSTVSSAITSNLPAIVSLVNTRLNYYNSNGIEVY